MKYCSKCTYPGVSAAPLLFDEHGVCSGCRVNEAKSQINWEERWKEFEELVDEYRSESHYDILVSFGLHM